MAALYVVIDRSDHIVPLLYSYFRSSGRRAAHTEALKDDGCRSRACAVRVTRSCSRDPLLLLDQQGGGGGGGGGRRRNGIV